MSSKSAKVPFGILNEANRGAKRINKNGDYNIPVKTLDKIFTENGKKLFYENRRGRS